MLKLLEPGVKASDAIKQPMRQSSGPTAKNHDLFPVAIRACVEKLKMGGPKDLRKVHT